MQYYDKKRDNQTTLTEYGYVNQQLLCIKSLINAWFVDKQVGNVFDLKLVLHSTV